MQIAPEDTETNQIAAFRALSRLRAIRAFERRHLPLLRSAEDCDLVVEIGSWQGKNRPLSVKQIHMLGIGSVATLHRRLRQLRKRGWVNQARNQDDRRTMQLTLSPRLLHTLSRYGALLG